MRDTSRWASAILNSLCGRPAASLTAALRRGVEARRFRSRTQQRALGIAGRPRLVGDTAHRQPRILNLAALDALEDRRQRDQGERQTTRGRAPCDRSAGRQAAGAGSPRSQARPAPGWYRARGSGRAGDGAPAIGRRRVASAGVWISTSACSAVMATAMSEGWTAMQASLAPRIAWPRFSPSSTRAQRGRVVCRAWRPASMPSAEKDMGRHSGTGRSRSRNAVVRRRRRRPRMVVTASPSCITASDRQELIRTPPTSTVQATRSQPFLTPIRPRCSRSRSSRVVRTSTSTALASPLTVSSNFAWGRAAPGLSMWSFKTS